MSISAIFEEKMSNSKYTTIGKIVNNYGFSHFWSDFFMLLIVNLNFTSFFVYHENVLLEFCSREASCTWAFHMGFFLLRFSFSGITWEIFRHYNTFSSFGFGNYSRDAFFFISVDICIKFYTQHPRYLYKLSYLNDVYLNFAIVVNIFYCYDNNNNHVITIGIFFFLISNALKSQKWLTSIEKQGNWLTELGTDWVSNSLSTKFYVCVCVWIEWVQSRKKIVDFNRVNWH